MPSIANYLKYGETALAAYAIGLQLGNGNTQAYQDADMSSSQAQRFNNTWQVLGQRDLSDGFSAVLFQQVDTLGQPVGQKVLAIRGSESSLGGIDYLADAINIALLGSSAGMSQYNSLQKFYQSLIDQRKLGAAESIVVTGHSLGGFLAQAFTAKNPVVSAAYTYNSPGFSVAPGVVWNLGTELLKLFGLSGTIPNEKIFNARALDGLSATAGLGQMLGSVETFKIEGTINPVTNHSIVTLTDSLVVYSAYAGLFPSLDAGKIGGLLQQSSNKNSLTIEAALDALRVTLIDGGIATDPAKRTPEGNRDTFYANLYALQDSAGYKTLANTAAIKLLSGIGTAVGEQAKTDFGTLVALKYLLPFAIEGSNSTLIDVHADLYRRWQADRTNRAAGSTDLNFSDLYLQDRAGLLQAVLASNTLDNPQVAYLPDVNVEYHYFSGGPEQILFTNPASLRPLRIVEFADDAGRTLTGFDRPAGDHLYGGTGADIVDGRAGSDYLEGGAGNDTLTGGTDNDTLVGGAGFDTYVYTAGDGQDTIIDADGQGQIQIDGQTLGVGTDNGDGHVYRFTDSASREHAYVLLGDSGNLLIDGKVTVKNFKAGDLGLGLGTKPQTDLQTTLTINGDITPTDTNPSKAGIQADADAQGNPIGTAQPYADILGGSAGNDHILGGELNDDIAGETGDDWIEGGSGNDYIGGRTGNDLIEGGAGSDILIGEEGGDRLYADTQIDIATAVANGNSDTGSGQKGDWLSGNAGDDILIAGADNDVLAGGAGADLLIAGAGEDFILGDSDYMAQFLWADTPSYSIGSTDWYHSSPNTFDWTVTETGGEWTFAPVVGETNPVGGGADAIYAGEGNDHVWAGEGDDVVYGEGGNDTLDGQAGNDILIGGAGDDTLFGGENNDYLDGGDGVDTLWGGNGDDELFGGSGDDKLYGEAGANYLDGEDGNDTLNSGGPGSELFGGAGNDDISAAGGGNYLDGEDGNDTVTADGGNNILFGGASNDNLSASGGNNYLDGEEGDNTLYADGGGNTLFAGAGDDGLSAGGGNNYLDGGDGTNTIVADGGGNALYGGTGDDTVSSAGGGSYLDGGDGTNLLIADGGGNTLLSGTGDDTLSSTGGGSSLDGGDGNDTLIVDTGNNTLYGGAGDDTLSSAGGGSYLDGGDGNDILVVDGGGNTLLGGAGADQIQGGGGNDNASGGEGDDTLLGNVGDDVLAGDEGNDWLQGDDGNDTLDGGAGDDTLLGGVGSDTLIGGEGDDILQGGAGRDYLYGGEGFDLYRFSRGDGVDYISDFSNPDISYGVLSNAMVFNFAYFNSGLQLGLGSLMLDFGNGDVIHLEGFDPQDPYANNTGIGEFRFTDTTLAYKDIIDLGFDITGTPDADVLVGTGTNDRMDGLASDDVLLGGKGDDVLIGGEGADTLIGGTGNDAYVIDAEDTVIENAGEGYDVVNADFSATLGANLEELDLIGTDNLEGIGNDLANAIAGNDGDNALYGLAGDDTLRGNDGNDTLDGGTGDDFMAGGSGHDLYIVDSEDDVVAEAQDLYNRDLVLDAFGNVIQYGALESSGGYDMVESSVSFGLDQWTEDLVLTGNDAIDGVGNVESNYIEGNDADNALYAYRLNGHADLYPTGIPFIQQFTVDRNAAEEMLADKANAAIFRGETQWYSPLSVDLYANEGDMLVGNGGNDRLYGGLDNDVLIGGDGNDLLYGFAGADYMEGGVGDDTYVVSGAYDFSFGYQGGDHLSYSDAGVDELYEAADEGTDTIVAEVDFALPENFENLTLVYDTRDYDPDGTISTLRFGRPIATVGEGNEFDNVITANDAGNELYGYGGADTMIGGAGNDYLEGGEGADTLRGGAGDDAYDVDNAGDLVIEYAGGGHDEVHSGIDYTLSANVEDLYLVGATYTENLSGSGNELDNLIVGNDGDNVLLGLAGNDVLDGGAGDDVMDGGAGGDTYYVDSEYDVTTESADQGHDTVYASVSHLLGDNIEDLYLTGSDDISGEGNALDNLIVGNDGYNYLEGYAGNDVIEGNGGDDELYGDAGNDVLRGGDGYDYIAGGDGNDVLDGGADGDTMGGGAGDDSYYVDSWGDQVYEAPGEGHDTVYSTIDFSLPDDVEDLTLVGDFQGELYGNGLRGDGNDLDNRIIGSDTSNNLSGQGGDDYIDGRADSDYINGGDGNDTLYGGDDASLVADTETPVWIDEEQVGSFSTHIEILASNDDRLYGDAGNDAIDGGSGNDDIYGGEGDDHLYGGDDGIVIAGDRYYEANGEVGSLYAAVSGGDPADTSGQFYYNNTNFYQVDIAGPLFLANDDYIDGGSGNDVIDGGSGNDYLYGGDGDDTLLGGADGPLNTSNNDTLDGGAGIDYMAGGTGDDIYYVDGSYTETTDIPVYGDCGELIPGAVTRLWTTDTVFEYTDEGYDTVYSYADYTLSDNVENLYLQWYSAAQLGRGNALDNSIYGNDNDNRLEGGAGDDYLDGGWGNDVLDGGAGNDVLVGGAGDDVYNLGVGSGRDTVYNDGGGFDVVHVLDQLGAGDVSLSRSGDDVTIALTGTADRMVLSNWFGSGERVQAIDFCDGTSLDETQIADLANAHILTAATDYAEVQEDGVRAATGNVLDNDSDSLGHALSVVDPATIAGAYGTLALAADGSYSYALDNNAVQWLAEGESVSDSFGYEVDDANFAYASAALEVSIYGQNDAPTADTTADGTIVEGNPGTMLVAGSNQVANGGFEYGYSNWVTGSAASGYYWTTNDARSGGSAAFGYQLSNGLLSQDVPTVEGVQYALDFWVGTYGAGSTFNVSWNGETVVSVSNAYLSAYTDFHVDAIGAAGSSYLEFDVPYSYYFVLDDVAAIGPPTEVPTQSSASGTLAFSDVDLSDLHASSVQPQAADYLGSFDAQLVQDSNGSGSGAIDWNFQVDDSAIDYLSEGQTLTQYYDVTIDDGHAGGSVTQTVAVNIVGTNDAPTITYADDRGAVAEDRPVWDSMGNLVVPAVETASGEIDFADVDLADVHSVTVQAADMGYVGSLDARITGDADSTGYGDGWLDWTFTVDNNAIDYLAEGEELEQTYDVTVSDGYAAATQSVSVTITGANDAPVLGEASGAVTEDAAPAVGLVAGDNLLANGGFENGDLSGWSLAGSTDQVGVDNLSFDGGYAGLFGAIGADAILGQDVQTTAGQQYLLDFRLMGGGDQGTDFSVSWNGATLAALADVSLPDYTEFQYVVSGADGLSHLEFGLRDDPDFWRLDGITLQPLLPGVLVPQQESTSGSIAFTDADLSDVHDMDAEAAGPDYLGDFSLGELHDSTGTGSGSIDWSFSVEDGAIQYLAEGESLTQYYDVTVYDDYTSGIGTPGVTVTINGANDAPEITNADASGAVAEDAQVLDGQGNPVVPLLQTASGEIDFVDVDLSDAHTVTAQPAAAGYVGSLDAQLIEDSTGINDGWVQWTFAAANGALDYLAQGELLEQTYNVIVDDGHTGGTATQAVTVSILGANDAPVTQDDAASVQEDMTLSATGNVLANDSDPDHGTVMSVAAPGPLTGAYGALSLAADGAYSYALDNNSPDVQSLRAGQTVTDSFAYAATDGIVSTPGMLAVTVTGTNDAPLAHDDTGAAEEDGGPVSLSGALLLANDTDVDVGDTKTITAVTDSAAGALVSLAGGNLVYDVGTLFQTLKQGATTTDAFTYTMADGAGAASSATVTMTLTGVNDAPVVANPIADQSATAGSPFSFSFAANTFFDIDAGDSLAYTATLGDGTALPTWLVFDAATRTFSGTPPGGTGTGGGCGGGTGTASSLQLRVNATDTAGASAFEDFALNIAGGSSGSGDDDGHDSYDDHEGGDHGGNDHGGSGHDGDQHQGDRREGERYDDGRKGDSAKYRDVRDAIAARLEKTPNYDFAALSTYLAQHQSGGYGALTPAQVAAQWRSVQDRVAQLAQDDEDSRHGAHGGEHYGGDDGFAHGAMFWGYAGATGQNRGCGGMATFGGLDEGFRKLG